MYLKNRINLKVYGILSLLNLAVAYFAFAQNSFEAKVLVIIVLSAILNQFLLAHAINLLIAVDRTPNQGMKAGGYFLLKTLVLGGAFYWGATTIADRIVYGIILYIIQLINLGFSIKK